MLTISTHKMEMGKIIKNPISIYKMWSGHKDLNDWREDTQRLHSFIEFKEDNQAVHSTTIPYEVQLVTYEEGDTRRGKSNSKSKFNIE